MVVGGLAVQTADRISLSVKGAGIVSGVAVCDRRPVDPTILLVATAIGYIAAFSVNQLMFIYVVQFSLYFVKCKTASNRIAVESLYIDFPRKTAYFLSLIFIIPLLCVLDILYIANTQ